MVLGSRPSLYPAVAVLHVSPPAAFVCSAVPGVLRKGQWGVPGAPQGNRVACVQSAVRHPCEVKGQAWPAHLPAHLPCLPVASACVGRGEACNVCEGGPVSPRCTTRTPFSVFLLQSEQLLDEVEEALPIWKVESPLNVRVVKVSGLKLGKKLGLFGSESVSVSAALYYGNTKLCAPMATSWCRITSAMVRAATPGSSDVASAAVVADVPFDYELAMGIAMKNIPRAARLIFTVSLRSGVIAWAGCVISEVRATGRRMGWGSRQTYRGGGSAWVAGGWRGVCVPVAANGGVCTSGGGGDGGRWAEGVCRLVGDVGWRVCVGWWV